MSKEDIKVHVIHHDDYPDSVIVSDNKYCISMQEDELLHMYEAHSLVQTMRDNKQIPIPNVKYEELEPTDDHIFHFISNKIL